MRYIDETSQDQTQYHLSFLKPTATYDFNTISKRLKTTHYTLRKAYVSFNGVVGFDSHTIFGQTDFEHNATTAKVIGHFYEVVVTGYLWASFNFVHSIQDFYAPLFLLPESIRKRAHIIVFSMPFLSDSLLDLLGFSPDRRIYLPENTDRYIAADVLHCFVNKTFYISQWGPNLYRFKQFLHQKYELDKIQSTDYCFSNRPKGKRRHIHNLDEVINATKSKFPKIDWKFIRDDHKKLIDCAKDFKKIKFLFAPVGSNICKCIFMADRSLVICVTAQFIESSLAGFSASCKIFELQYDSIAAHHSGVGSPIDVDDALFHIGKCLKVLETGSWKVYSDEEITYYKDKEAKMNNTQILDFENLNGTKYIDE
ncbi:hypothetical protein TVAG_004760 [Trichomonas vaginalis G3]|uniref:Glycosyltransferase 61 catalytic domain-containing protein n=1 Tax=Trichomonas vaginalis (strain ATCC PRA-98 / G3) TaxID=412133 RepID=A2DT38_TRIV3|nr:glycosyltransferase family [Trichomonas vaginalis G3]EAY16445.1 hypothetical protein TVAG_004760 [Trichomonas vaginalis G3]KAI5505690.1 glycosyltransferase family [Trichomonas vaginalis G3]|eukprot:XP_001328668.1 hypothetical protein [Trichomonas vaginalis G3]